VAVKLRSDIFISINPGAPIDVDELIVVPGLYGAADAS
jgi:hypothetical protein